MRRKGPTQPNGEKEKEGSGHEEGQAVGAEKRRRGPTQPKGEKEKEGAGQEEGQTGGAGGYHQDCLSPRDRKRRRVLAMKRDNQNKERNPRITMKVKKVKDKCMIAGKDMDEEEV